MPRYNIHYFSVVVEHSWHRLDQRSVGINVINNYIHHMSTFVHVEYMYMHACIYRTSLVCMSQVMIYQRVGRLSMRDDADMPIVPYSTYE